MAEVKVRVLLEGLDVLAETLAGIPDQMQNRVLRFAGRKASNAVAMRAKANTPRNKKGGGMLGHLADRYTYRQAVYRQNAITVNIIGSLSGESAANSKNKINHLVEFGNFLTRPRMTKHRSVKARAKAGVIVRSVPISTGNGRYKSVKKMIPRFHQYSLGSVRDWRKKGEPRSTGNMPAFHQLELATQQVDIDGIFEDELAAGINRIIVKQLKKSLTSNRK